MHHQVCKYRRVKIERYPIDPVGMSRLSPNSTWVRVNDLRIRLPVHRIIDMYAHVLADQVGGCVVHLKIAVSLRRGPKPRRIQSEKHCEYHHYRQDSKLQIHYRLSPLLDHRKLIGVLSFQVVIATTEI